MVPGPNNPFEKQLNNSSKFKANVLKGYEKAQWPDRIDYIAKRLADGDYTIQLQSGGLELLEDGRDLEKTAGEFYLEGINALTGSRSRQANLPTDFRLGELLVQFAGLSEGLKSVNRHDVPPGEILSRLLVRSIKRQSTGRDATLAQQLRSDTETPRELVAELASVPELASEIESALPDPDDPSTLTTELASLDLTTELWDHQLESLALWLHHDMNGYVDMATATGKTVLGLATVAHAVDFGSLHPADQDRLDEIFDGNVPEPRRSRPNDVLIVTTDDLLGVQWARLLQEHCHTPPAFTQVDEGGIRLLEHNIEIRSARALADVDPADYRLAIFDEVHNYSGSSGWGKQLTQFIDSPCPTLALTGSVTEQFETQVAQTDRRFPVLYRYTHRLALKDGVIPDFEWTVEFTGVRESDALAQFRETAGKFRDVFTYSEDSYYLNPTALGEVAPELSEDEISALAGEYKSGSAVASGLREAGSDGVAPTEWLEELAHGLGNRTIHRLNLRCELSQVTHIAEQALSDERPVLILTQSYEEGKEIWQELYEGNDDRVIRRLESGQSASTQDDLIQQFDDADTNKKVLIGPGKRIGQGNDIHSVEVGINISRPGSGVNATLVQRLGRLLRDASKDTVEFYHIVGVPPAETATKPDGESFIRSVAEFFGQVLEPDTDGILKVPSITVDDSVVDAIKTLESLGAPSIEDDPQATVIESAYAAAISERDETNSPAVETDWFSAAFGKVGMEEEAPETEITAGAGAQSTVPVSPLAEHYDVFWRLCVIQKALLNNHLSGLDDNDPFREWATAAQSMVNEDGFEEQNTGYGKQQLERNSITLSAYREEYGNGTIVTESQTVSVTDVPGVIQKLLRDVDLDLTDWTIPVSPQSEKPLPVVIESETELENALDLLREFPSKPPVTVDSGQTKISQADSTADSKGQDAQEESSQTISDQSPDGSLGSADTDDATTTSTSDVPVEEVRGVSTAVSSTLHENGYETLRDLQTATDDELAAIDGVSKQRVTLIRAAIGSDTS